MLTSGVSGMRPWGRRLPTAPAGAFSRETFLTRELPGHMAADRQVIPAGTAAEGLSLPTWRTGARQRNDPIKCSKDFQAAHGKVGGRNASLHFPPAGNHARPYRAAQRRALKPDLIATING